MLDDVMAEDQRGSVARLEDGREHAQGSGFTRSIGPQQSINPSRLAGKTDIFDRANLAAFLVVEVLGQTTGFDHCQGLAYKGRASRIPVYYVRRIRKLSGRVAHQRHCRVYKLCWGPRHSDWQTALRHWCR